jgi:predicted dehydrogenase
MSPTLSRRELLLSTAGLALTPLVARAASLARPARPRRSVNDKITLGFIGIGVMNRDHLGRFLKDDAVHVAAVCDVDQTRRDDAKQRVDKAYGDSGGSSTPGSAQGCAAFNDYRDLLARRDIDAVVIATPDHWHAIIVIEACKAGKDIYCEKPLSLTLHEAKAMIDAVRKHDRVFQTGSQQRTEYGGRFRTACEYIRSGRLGQLISANVGVGESSVPCDLPEEPAEPGLDWDRWLGPAPLRPYNSILSPRGIHTQYPQWRKYREYSGGTMTDMGAHHFDIVQWALGMDQSGPVEVRPPRNPESKFGATLTYASGVEVHHGGPTGSTFIGTDGMIQIDRDRIISIPDDILKKPLTDSDTHLPQAKDHHANWIDGIRSRQRPICDVEVGARSITCPHLLNLAYWHRRTLKWDPASWEFPGDAEANAWRDYHRREAYQLPSA